MVVADADAAQARMIAAVVQADKDILALWAVDPAAAIEFGTNFGVTTGDAFFQERFNYWLFLFASFRVGPLPASPTTCITQFEKTK